MPPIDVLGATRTLLTPTDVTQFVRLEQCARFLRLMMHERAFGLDFWGEIGALPQGVTPLLRTSGEAFEERVENRAEAEIANAPGASTRKAPTRVRNMKPRGSRRSPDDSENDNAAVLGEIAALENGAVLTMFQPRLRVRLGAWIMRGDIDILQLRRDENGALHILIADMKSSREPRVEHRLQVAFYREMVETLLRENRREYSQVDLGIVYRGPDDAALLQGEDLASHEEHLKNARRFFGHDEAPLHLLNAAEKDAYRESVESLVTGKTSRAAQVAAAEFDAVPFHIERKCADCRFQQFCLKRAATRDDLSLLPHLSAQEKNALLKNGVDTIGQLAGLKTLRRETAADENSVSETISKNAADDAAAQNETARCAATPPISTVAKEESAPSGENTANETAPQNAPLSGATSPLSATLQNTVAPQNVTALDATAPQNAASPPSEIASQNANATSETAPPNGASTRAVENDNDLLTAPENRALVNKIAATWPVGPRLDELIHRARRYRFWRGDKATFLRYIPHKGHGSLPFCSATHNPNLVRVYLDAQHDHLHDRVYLLGARIVACENGEVASTRSIVKLAQSPPGAPPHRSNEPIDGEKVEAELLTEWLAELLLAVYEMAAPNAAGEKKAPLHLIFWNAQEQTKLLEALGRHATTVLAATPLYDFLTQLPAFDSSNFTFLDAEIRELKNYPLLAQSLQSVSEHLRFAWDAEQPFRRIFRDGIFDYWGKLEDEAAPSGDEVPWFTARARFHSNVPLEYAYAAWDALPAYAPSPKAGQRRAADEFAPYRNVSRETLTAFQEKRLEAIAFIAESEFSGNKLTSKAEFDLSKLPDFASTAPTLAAALSEFATIERHVTLQAWKGTRQLAPERRVLAGETLLVRYHESDQDAEIAARNRDNARRRKLAEEWKAALPEGEKLTKEQRDATRENFDAMTLRLRLECADLDCDAAQALEKTTLREGSGVVLYERHTFDSRLPEIERFPFTPTPRQMLYGMRGTIARFERGAHGEAWLHLEIGPPLPGSKNAGYAFQTRRRALCDGELCTLDADPNDWYGAQCAAAVEELNTGARNTLYTLLEGGAREYSQAEKDGGGGQKRFLQGLDALGKLDADFTFEESKRAYIGGFGSASVLLVQGPPGTGKSYATAFAILARMQNAIEEDREFRVFCGCKTHAATDVLIEKVAQMQAKLRDVKTHHPQLFARYFDERLLRVPLFRLVRASTRDNVEWLPQNKDREKGQPPMHKRLQEERWCIAATTPGGVYRLRQDAKKTGETLHGGDLCDCLVLDEASQMGLPEAMMAALTLRANGQIIVVGDDRQMAPIVKHNWDGEARRTFTAFKSYDSLFSTLRELSPPLIQFEESFRLHADIAEFLRREVYAQDGIAYHSKRTKTLDEKLYESLPPDDFLRAVLQPQHPLIVVVHDENESLLHNEFECKLMQPILEVLASPQFFALNTSDGFGVVVPHRAQKARLRERIGKMEVRDKNGQIAEPPVDTVERFQGDERDAILVSATESDPAYLLAAGKFLMNPQRLNVALSRAKNKMILVAARTVFDLFSADEETFQNARLWKNLLRHTCTKELHRGVFEGVKYVVYGNEK